jgi:hypothetical protein
MNGPLQPTAPPIALNLQTHLDEARMPIERCVRRALIAQRLATGQGSFTSRKDFAVAVALPVDEALERLAMTPLGASHRVDAITVMMVGDGLYAAVVANGARGHTALSGIVYADLPAQAEAALAVLLATVRDHLIEPPREKAFTLDWHFLASDGATHSVDTTEHVEETLLDAAYPWLTGGVEPFIRHYLDAQASVLLLQGPPGTGKTRLVRAILAALSDRLGRHAQVMYACDEPLLHRDEMFLKFLTGRHDVFLVEDADLLLTPRADGNRAMHRFLNIADGVVRAQQRKVIFTTNLRHLHEIDEALVRPGRAYACMAVRELTLPEARRLLEQLCGGDEEQVAAAMARLGAGPRASLAEVYAALRTAPGGDAGLRQVGGLQDRAA